MDNVRTTVLWPLSIKSPDREIIDWLDKNVGYDNYNIGEYQFPFGTLLIFDNKQDAALFKLTFDLSVLVK